MTKEEWLMEFQVLNGRIPTDEEIAFAEAKGFQAVQATQSKAKFPFSMKVDWLWLVRGALLVLMAIFGYIVGYLFT